MITSLELLCVFPFIVDECLYNIDNVVKNQRVEMQNQCTFKKERKQSIRIFE